MPDTDPAPTLLHQTLELGTTLKAIADSDPTGTPSELSGRVFLDWLTHAGPGSRRPEFFADVLANFVPPDNTNRDLDDLFTMLQSYIEVPDEDYDAEDPAPPKTFIDLPLHG